MPSTPSIRRIARIAATLVAVALGSVATPASAQTATVGDGAAVGASSACPGGAGAVIDAFTLGASIATNAAGVRVTLYPAGAYSLVERVQVASDDLGTVLADTLPVSDVVELRFATPLPVGTTPVQYRVVVKPKTHAAMPPGGAEYTIRGQVTTVIRGTGAFVRWSYADRLGPGATVDNLGPQDVLWSDLLVGASDATLSWAGVPDVVVLRRAGGAVTESLADGQSYSAGQAVGQAAVRFAGVSGTFVDTGLTGGASYYYRVFVRDACGNWSEGSTVGPVVPGGVAEGDTRANIRTPVVGILNPSPGTLTPPVRVQVRVFSPNTTGGATQPILGAVLSADNGAITTNHTLVRNTAYGTATDSGVFEVQLSSADLPAGRYTLRASATNGAGSVNSGAVWVVVGSAKGDGNLLVRDNSSQLCSDCHAHATHASEATGAKYGSWYAGCRACHQPHGTTNASLIADVITPPAVGGPKPPSKVYYAGAGGYSATGGAANPGAASYANADATGPCQVCHTRTAYYTRDGLGLNHNPGTVCTSCHQHAKGLAASCSACHGTAGRVGIAGADALVTAAPPAGAHAGETAETNAHVGEHVAHVNQATYRTNPLACANCHTIPNQHNGSSDTLTFAGLGSTGTVATYVGGTCSNYCHGATLGGGSNPTPSWAAGETTGCTSCHGGPPPAPHVSRTDCGTCHGVGYSSSTVAKGTHIDGNLNLDTMTCSGCHGNSGRTPVASAATLDANGDNIVLAAPPVDASNAGTGTKVGAHLPHVNQGATAPAWTNAITCAVCHPVPTSATASGAHRDSLPSVAFTGTGAAAGASYSAGTCSSTYCHGNFAGGNGANPVSWGTGTLSKVACTSCHAGPPALSAASHHPNNTACATCHGAGYSTTTVAAATHVNKTVDRSRTGCTLCHGDLTATGVLSGDGRVAPGYNLAAADTTGATAATSAGVGAHGKHLTSTTYIATPVACGNCHAVPADADVSHATGGGTGGARATLGFSGLATSNNFGQITAVPPAYSGSTTDANGNTAGTCSNTYCHGNFTNGANATPSWTATGLTCNSCHGRTPGANPASPPGGTHPNDSNCGGCHTSYTGSSVNLTLHMNGQKDYAGHPAGWKEPDQHGTGPSGALVSGLTSCTSCHTGFGPVGATASSSCNGCHASPSTYGPYTTGTYPNHTNWQTECTFCHGGRDSTTTGAPPRDTTIISTDPTVQPTTLASIGAHSSHAGIGASPTQSRHAISNELTCDACHGSVPADLSHVDGGATVMGFANVGPTPNPGTYAGGASPTCSSNYCHGNFTGGVGTGAVAWTGSFGGTLTLTCASCHGSPPSITVGHPQNTTCTDCHSGYTNSSVVVATHVDGTVTLDAARAACVSCHGTPGRASVAGADANQPAAPPVAANSANANAVGAHTAHVNVIGVRSPLACSECHAVPTAGDRTHINGSTTASVTFPVGGLARTGGATPTYAGGASPACNGVYCHTRAGASAPSPSWTGTLTGCGTCHASPPPQSAGHPQRTDCDACHGIGYTSTAVTGTALGTHVNGTLNLVSAESCTSCHGTPGRVSQPNADAFQAAAPPVDTTNVSLVSDVDVGVHVQHVNSTRSRAVVCAECHTGEVPGATQFDHATGSTTISFGALARTGAVSPTYSGGATPTCSASYCHGNFAGGAGAGATPVWTTQATLACTSCHGNPPAISTNHPQNTTCGSCHGVGYSTTTVVQATHVDGTAAHTPASGCNQCHGDLGAAPAAPGTVAAAPGVNAGAVDSQGNTTTAAVGVGAHREHLVTSAATDAFACADCHPADYAVGDKAHANGTPAVPLTGLAQTGGAPASYASPNCSSVYCHSRAFPVGGTQTYTNPVWGSATITGCTACHDGGGAASTTLSSRHGRHVNSAASGNYAYACSQCHNTVAATDTSISAGGLALHVDGQRNVAFDTALNPSGGYTGGTYTCSSVYCHSNGSPLGGTISYANLTWNAGTVNATCTSCHGGDSTSGTNLATNKHPQHVNQASVLGTNYGCVDCHNATVSANRTLLSPPTQHVDGGVKDVGFPARAGGQTSAAYASPNCNSNYCHSSGQATPSYRAVAWNQAGALGCNGCHGTGNLTGAPDYASGGAGSATANSHAAHTSSGTDSTSCQNCHSGYVTAAGTAIAGSSHTDGFRNVALLGGGTYTQATKTCSGTACHGASSPQWGGAALSCASCHGGAADVNNWATADSTISIINTGTEWTTYGHGNTAATFNEFTGATDRCLYCHDSNVAHATPANPFRLRGAADTAGATGAFDVLAGKNGNEVCLNCHDTSNTVAYGVDPDGAGAQPRVGQGGGANPLELRIDAWHSGADHVATQDGGKRCWDCHDPHGDATNLAMIGSDTLRDGADDYGLTGTRSTTAAVLTTRGAGGYTNTTTRNGICQVCHTTTTYWRWNSEPTAHQSGADCMTCHNHQQPPSGAFKGSGDCTQCHNAAQGSRREVVSEFAQAWSHKRSGGGTVTKYDCTVCHMEGDATTGDPSAVHANGVINLRDPDTGNEITTVTYTAASGPSAGSFNTAVQGSVLNMIQFSRNLGSATIETNVDAIMVRQCLGCHDSNGALSTQARVPGGTAEKPFNTTIAGAGYTGAGVTANGVAGGVTDIKASFATTNSSYHPILGQQNNWYAKDVRMVAPWDLGVTTRSGTVNTTNWGARLSCWDCHAPAGTASTVTLTGTVTAHGGATTVRGSPTGSGVPPTSGTAATLCNYCHKWYNTCGAATNNCANNTGHGPNSAFSIDTGRSEKEPYLQYGCNMCHSSGYGSTANPTYAVQRPYRAQDVHGFNSLPPTNATTLALYTSAPYNQWSLGVKPYAFIRNTQILQNHAPQVVSGTTYGANCVMGVSPCGTSRTKTYTVGGTY